MLGGQVQVTAEFEDFGPALDQWDEVTGKDVGAKGFKESVLKLRRDAKDPATTTHKSMRDLLLLLLRGCARRKANATALVQLHESLTESRHMERRGAEDGVERVSGPARKEKFPVTRGKKVTRVEA
jgi:hypothetical protein